MMNLFLQQVSVEFADYFVVMQVDKAAIRTALMLSKFLRIFV